MGDPSLHRSRPQGHGPHPGDHVVFVYGTLLRGERHHSTLSRAHFLRDARTTPRFDLFDLGEYPALSDGGASSVHGELYAVNATTLSMLDEIEDHPAYYRREEVELDGGERAFAYLLPRSRVFGTRRIACGDWRERPRVGLRS